MTESVKTPAKSRLARRLLRYSLPYWRWMLVSMILILIISAMINYLPVLIKRMTDNRLSIRMETQKETKKGSLIETLDIKISDELGTRNYEMFSGGEAFRIDFALRIALSRLLTRRAGASLSTLVIDEGFGTQDSFGRDRLVDIINSIQDDFDKIIVVTHLEDIKDAFPVRIEVTKTPDGSTVSVE